MPWAPELFSAPLVERLEEERQREMTSVSYFDGLLSGEVDAMIGSFAGEPCLHDPVRGRVEGERAFRAFVAAMNEMLARRDVAVSEVAHGATENRGFEEVVLYLDVEAGRVELPHALVAAHRGHGQLEELRIYHSTWPLSGRHAHRPPLLQSDPDLSEADVVGEYQLALAAGDADAVVATFEADGCAREPAGGEHVHRGADDLGSFYEYLFSNGGGIPLEHCAVSDDGRLCALEYNVVSWGATELPPQAGMAVYERGPGGRLAAARIYDDVDPPLA
jgi:hypothetical protein